MRQKTDVYFNFWKSMVSWVNMYLNGLDNEDLKMELMPNGNHGVWILGHLIASEDDLSEYLGKGAMLFPLYQDIFKQGNKVQAVEKYPAIDVLRNCWKQVVDKNNDIYLKITDVELSEPHQKIKGKIEEDYFKTKEGCLKNWILHQMHHAGQLSVLRTISGKKSLV